MYQGYQHFVDNFYTSVHVLEELLKDGIVVAGTLRVSCKGIPDSVVRLKGVLDRSDVVLPDAWAIELDTTQVSRLSFSPCLVPDLGE